MTAIRVFIRVSAFVAIVLSIQAPCFAQRAARVCDENAQCFTIDTSAIGGRPFSEYRVVNPDAVMVDVSRRRAELAQYPQQASQHFAVNPLAAQAGSVPSLTFSQATASIFLSTFTANGVERNNELLTLSLRDVATSDGYSLPRFGLFLVRGVGETRMTVQFRPTIDSNLEGIPGFTNDLNFIADPATGDLDIPKILPGPDGLRRLIVALLKNLPNILQQSTINRQASAPGKTLWDEAGARAAAATVSNLLFTSAEVTLPPIPELICDLRPTAYTTCTAQNELNAFEKFLQKYGADYLSTASPGTARTLLRNLRSWAAVNALVSVPGLVPGDPTISDIRPKYHMNFINLPLVTTWVMLRNDPIVSAEDRTLIEGWISRLVAFSTEPYGGPTRERAPNNHGYLSASVRMAWGIAMRDDLAFAEGIERFYIALNQMRDEGSFPLEVSRGACSLRYQNTALSNLIAIAEMARTQGYDLYSLSVGSKTISTAANFLRAAVDDLSLVTKYPMASTSVCDLPDGAPMEVTFREPSPDGYTYAAWVESLAARIGYSSADGARIRSLINGGVDSRRPLYHAHSGGYTSAFSAPIPFAVTDTSFTLAASGAASLASAGDAALAVGSAVVRANGNAAPPAGFAIFGYRQGGILVSEAAVSLSTPERSGRIYAKVGDSVNTGVAISNPNTTAANVAFYFTNQNGENFGAGSIQIPAGGQKALFLDQQPFNSGAAIEGTFTYSSDAPVAAISLRGFTNERNEFLITTLPIAPLTGTGTDPVVFPHFADGGGWTTQIVLINPGDAVLSGSLQAPVPVSIGGQTSTSFAYSIPARSSRRFVTSGAGPTIQSGAIRVVPSAGSSTPVGVAIFSFKNANGVTVSEAGVPAARPAASWRVYVEASGGAEQVQTGLALANTSSSDVQVTMQLATLSGSSSGMTATVTVPANGQRVFFLNQIPGFTSLNGPFQGVLRIASAGTAVMGLRARYNERGDFLITTTQPVFDGISSASGVLMFPHFANGGGYTTQFVLLPGSPTGGAGSLTFMSQAGQPVRMVVR